jgi:hypothetical protein
MAKQKQIAHGPGPPVAVSALSVLHIKSVLYGAFEWARRALHSLKRRFPAWAEKQKGIAAMMQVRLPPSRPSATPC